MALRGALRSAAAVRILLQHCAVDKGHTRLARWELLGAGVGCCPPPAQLTQRVRPGRGAALRKQRRRDLQRKCHQIKCRQQQEGSAQQQRPCSHAVRAALLLLLAQRKCLQKSVQRQVKWQQQRETKQRMRAATPAGCSCARQAHVRSSSRQALQSLRSTFRRFLRA